VEIHGYDINGKLVDHEDWNGLNNDITNLRMVTVSQNCQHRRGLQSNNTSGYVGVYKSGNKWEARLGTRPQIRTGYFSEKITAAIARDAEAIKHYGSEFIHLNFPILAHATNITIF
jgi:hypothetical protein